MVVQIIKKTESGILIPEKSAETPIEGEVLAVGPGILRDTGTREVPSVKPGDRVILPQYHGIKIKINEDEVSIYKDSEIMAKIDPQA